MPDRQPALRLVPPLALLLLAAVLALSSCTAPSRTGRSAPATTPASGADSTAPASAPAEAPSPAPSPAPAPAPKPTTQRRTAKPIAGLHAARVVRVVDGDTAVFSVGGRQEKTRFIGVDTPESTIEHEPYGEEASAYTKRVLKPGRLVYLEHDAELRDRYGRLLAYVWLAAPTNRSDASLRSKQFNAKLLLDGYAQQMTIQPNSRYADSYTLYVREARNADRGLWGLPVAGSSGGSGGSSSGSGTYVGSRRSNKFHTRQCQWGQKISPANLVVFKTRAAAVNAGYVPCKVCRP